MDTDALTTTDFWASHWASFNPPYRIDLRSYRWYAYDRLLSRLMPKGARVLEVGSGLCQWLVYFHERFGMEILGLDNSLDTCRLGKRNLMVCEAPPNVVCSDFRVPGLALAKVDVVFTDGVVEHFRDYGEAVATLSRLVAPGGLVVTTIPNFAGLFGRLRRIENQHIADGHVPITLSQLREAHRRAGLVELEAGCLASLRLPWSPLVAGKGWRSWLGAPPRLLVRLVDRLLTTLYRVVGRGIESPFLSAELYVAARRPADERQT